MERPTGRRPPRSKSPACSARLRRPSGRARSSPASRRASSTPIATRTAAKCGRTRCSGPASAPASRRSPTSTPIPVIDNGQVFAVGQGGRMVALELITGQRHVGAQHRRHLDAVGRGRLGVRGHRRRQADLRLPPERPHPLDQPAAAVREGQVEEGRDRIFGPGPRRRTADRHRLQRRADLRRSGDRRIPEPDRPSARGISLPPVVANSTLYIFDDRGRLHAFS